MTTGKKVLSLMASTSCDLPMCSRFAYQSPSRVVGGGAVSSTRKPFSRVSSRRVQRTVNTTLFLTRRRSRRGNHAPDLETTLANRSYARSIREWQAAGYHVALWFLALPSAEAALARVAQRVLQGGHHIPDEVVRRRFVAGKANLEGLYKGLVDAWVLYDNSETVPVLLDWGEKR